MEKTFEHKYIEERITDLWEKGGYFKAAVDPSKKPYTIVLPPPNASGKMHTGNVLMIAIEDLLIRWKRMKGYSALWLPGTDHAGFETQITFERELSKQGKSRLDYDRTTLYQMIWDYVQKNRNMIEQQIKRMGASVDWSRYTFTLDDKVIKTVHETFKKLHKDNLIYRGNYIVNYCPRCGTTFADLEIDFVERKDPLYYIRYPLVSPTGSDKYVVIATCRPETIFADVWLAVNPKDKKKKDLVGKKAINPLNGETLEIIADSFVDPKFGTGIVKITPAHDKNDYEVGLRQGIDVENQIKTSINFRGKMTEIAVMKKTNGAAESLAGESIKDARAKTVEFLHSQGFMEKIDDTYSHMVSVCYKGNHDIEPTIIPNWFVKVGSLKKPALEAVKEGKIKIFPKWQEKGYIRWMEEMRDWPISRQVVWGIRIPVWYKVKNNEDKINVNWIDKENNQHQGTVKSFLDRGIRPEDMIDGIQRVITSGNVEYEISAEKPSTGDYIPETDTFDTWFSSGQWPLVTLGYPDSADFKYFYPTAVLETGWEIIRFWVSRMIMFGMYLTKGTPPFEHVYLHGMVRALDGKKMSKSLGNVINPEEYQELYGTDALRMGLISGTANGKDFAFPRDKVIGYRNFANKLWNMTRFMLLMMESEGYAKPDDLLSFSNLAGNQLDDEDKEILKGLKTLAKKVDKDLEKYRFSDAAEAIYQYLWHEVADKYIESVKNREDKKIGLCVLRYVLINSLKLLHPFMPFVTEALWQEIWGDAKRSDLAASKWPEL